MRMYGYGEDGLTYRALTDRLGEILSALGDATPVQEAVVFYRPSFGRKAGSRLGTRVSQFGEFDGIVGTHEAVYLIESKWSRSVEVYRKPTLQLREEQLRRHKIFRWLLTRWRALRPESWEAFRETVRTGFEDAFPSFTIAHADSGVALNLAFVLRQLATCGDDIQDVLLYTTIDEDHRECPPFAEPSVFKQVRLWFPDADRSGFYIFGESQAPLEPLTTAS